VVAKRYLVTTDSSYRDSLSRRSVETLAAQGDVLEDAQVAALERDPDFDAIISLRRADERAKDPNAQVPGLDSWRVRLEAVTASS
jgi:predicted HD phosphohydrolase